MQELIIFLVFLAALTYLGNRAYRSFFAKKKAGCGKGCGCATDAQARTAVAEK
ncbi:FeoB-associated Cys-rich membrane protein [Spirosoma sp.]|uniref:FeoB-associated Cys-rich membrane protein n=1 Tax=Spirosoma sp. TaxID=1899569 RepID=UPI003B3B07F4